ncbi:hypothetical protein CBR_g30685 [Chara braunii]|uniref:Integrase catalytic domain-containing protein n=1 Tax=Chara braunii TaxID=69332 RepID=A0A388LDG7_CHABU|nr:hypothetical protein CBR_g30685 [Chara braunii]|eukprot:GBG80317.1 hypothetical protein CBR_g30685 [Chara braunii]
MDLAHDEATYSRLLRRQHFQETEEREEPTEEESNKEGTAVLMENLMYTCNWQQRELLAMRQVFIRHETTFKALDKKIATLLAEISTLHAVISQQQTLNDQLQTDVSMGLAQPSAAASTGSAVVDCSPALAAQAKQLEERINRAVASLNDISKFAGASTVSNQLQTLSDRVEQRPAAAAKEWKMPNFKIEKFDDYHKTDPLKWWMASNAEADVHHTPAHRRLDALYLQLIGGVQAFMTHMAVTLECTIANLHTKITWEEFEKKWKIRFMVNNDKRHAMNKIFCIYPGQQTSWEWLTEWQRLVATPELNLPFDSIRAEFFARSCDALTAALGSEFQYETFDDMISKARELIQACEAVSFDILDTKFDMILGMSWLQSEDHPVNFHRRTVHVCDQRGELVPCTVPLPHPSIGCHVVSAASIRQSIRRNDIEEMGICFFHALPPGDQPKMDTSDPRIIELLDNYEDVFQAPAGVIPDRPIRHGITLEDGAVPPRGCIYRMSEEELQVLRAQLDDLLAKGWIRPSCLLYGAPVLFVWKKNKDLRLCTDYRKLNAQTIKNACPLPRVDDLLERLGGAKYFSKLDLKSGCHQIEIQPRDRYKTTFKTRYGLFEWIVMPFRLTNAPTNFQAAMTAEFRDLLDRTVLIYLDDILVYSQTLDVHLEHLRAVLERLRIAKYKANRDKCECAQQELEYLGHYVTPQGIRPLADKVQAFQDWSYLKCTTDIRSFLALASYYMRFVKGFQRIAAPLSRLQSPLVPFEFSDEARHVFHTLKTTLLQAPVLSIYDPTLPTKVTTDASGYDIGAVLEQHEGTDWHPVEYFSQKLPPINSLDDARKKELLAFVTVLERWRHFLLGRRRFTWATDNNPLTYYKMQDTVSSTIGRWMYFIDQFDFTSKHIPGSSNKAADALSRRPDFCALVHSTFGLDENLQQHFINGYKADPGLSTLYSDLSSDHPPASNYRIVDGYLLLHIRGKDLLCVPQDRILRTRLLGEYHDSWLAGHLSVARTLTRLRQRSHWSNIISDINRYIQSCAVCHRNKGRHQVPYDELKPLPIPREPGLSIAMDVTGPFPRDRLGHDGILTVVDHLSKYARFLPCKHHATAPELARLLHTGWFCSHGVPEDIVSDHDTCVMSAFWTTLMVEFGTSMKPSFARHPQTDGQTERAHQTAQMMLRTLIRPDQKDWVDRLPDIEFAYNTLVHLAIGVTPFKLHHGGRKGRIFADILLPRPADIDAACSPASTRKYRELLAKARANMQKAQVRMQQQANRRRIPCPIRVGDLVWVTSEEFALEQHVSRKLLPKWFGPWKGTSAAGDDPAGPSFIIEIPPHLTVHPIFHASKLAVYTPASAADSRADDHRTLLLWMIIRRSTAFSRIANMATSLCSTKLHLSNGIRTTHAGFQELT